MNADEEATGTREQQYNLKSVLYHALHVAETIEAYILVQRRQGTSALQASLERPRRCIDSSQSRRRGSLASSKYHPNRRSRRISRQRILREELRQSLRRAESRQEERPWRAEPSCE